MAKGSSINGNGGGKNGGNNSYTVTGRGEVSRAKLVKEVKQGQHPDAVTFISVTASSMRETILIMINPIILITS